MRKLVALLFAACLLAGCASVGEPFDPSKVASFQKGITTRAQVEAALGKPATTTATGDGQTLCLWVYASASNHAQNFVPVVNVIQSKMDVHSQTFSAIFDDRGVLVNYSASESNMTGRGGLVR